MKTWLRRLRAALLNGLTWAVAWCGAGLIAGTTGLLGQLAPIEYVVFGVSFAILGFASGIVFSALLSLAERRRRFDQLSLLRFGAWGALGGAGISMTMLLVGGASSGWLTTIGFFMILAAGSSTGSLALPAERSTTICSSSRPSLTRSAWVRQRRANCWDDGLPVPGDGARS